MKIEALNTYYKNIYKKEYTGEKTTLFEGYRIAQRHHPKQIVDDIYGENQTKQFTSIQVVGTPGTGKTTLVTYLAHEIHTRDPSYLVYQFGEKELMNFDKVLESLPNSNIILIFDDVSLIFKLIKDQDKKTRILKTLTEARHPKLETTDRKVIVIVNSHYENSIEKMWRSQSGWKFYTDLNTEEKEILNARTKSKFKQKFDVFVKTTLEQFRNPKLEYHVQVTPKLTYTYSPFKLRFVMVYDGMRPRFILVPSRGCSLCTRNPNLVRKAHATPDEIIDLMFKYYGRDGIVGLKLGLINTGQTRQFRNKSVYAYNMAVDMLRFFDIDHEKLANRMRERAGIKGTGLHTIRRKKTDFIADLEKIRTGGEISKIDSDIELENLTKEDNNKSELDIDSMDAEQSQTKTVNDES